MNIKEIFTERVKGNGNLSFVLVHNAGGDHKFFTHQIDALKNYGDIVLLDLPGHGSSASIADNTMDSLSAVISDICKHFSLENICLVGLNNGADIIINTSHKHNLPIKSMILIDPPLFMEQKFIGEINDFINHLDSKNYDEFICSLANNLFITTSEFNKNIALNSFANVNKKSLQEMFRSLIEWDRHSVDILQEINYPTLCILTDEHHCSYDKIKDKAPGFEIGKVVGSKCWATLEVPEQVNAMIERFLSIHT